MLIDDRWRESVGFLYARRPGDEESKPQGTVFLVSCSVGSDTEVFYYVTAAHVLRGCASRGLTEVFAHFNRRQSDSPFIMGPASPEAWTFSATADVAVLQAKFATLAESAQITAIPVGAFLADEQLGTEVDVGDEIFTVGMFSAHLGVERIGVDPLAWTL